jgi:hypothetical protein
MPKEHEKSVKSAQLVDESLINNTSATSPGIAGASPAAAREENPSGAPVLIKCPGLIIEGSNGIPVAD